MAELKSESTYTIRLDGVQDTAGNLLVTTAITFTTQNDEPTPPPEDAEHESSQTASE